MQTEINRRADGTIELLITIPWSEIAKKYDQTVEEALKTVEVKGFRKGKAPRNLAEKQLDQEKLWQKVLAATIPGYYSRALQKENIKPIIAPQIQLQKAAPENDLVLKAVTAEAPQVELGNYKQQLVQFKKSTVKIWTPDTAAAQTKTARQKNAQPPALDNILKKLLATVKITVPAILIEQETNRKLAQLLDQLKQLGMTLQQYAQSTGKTIEQIKQEHRKEAENIVKLEFILEKIADAEKITVEDKEIDEFITKIKDKKEQQRLQTQRYYLASLLRRQKTLRQLVQ